MSASISALNAVILMGRDIDLDPRIVFGFLAFCALFGLPIFFRCLLGNDKK